MLKRIFAHLSTWLLAAFFSWTTVVLAAAPLRALRLASPSWVFWPVSMVMVSGLWLVDQPTAALALAGVALLVGLFTEIEGWGGSRGVAGTGALVALVASAGLGFGWWCRDQKVSPIVMLTKWFEPVLAKLREINPSLEGVVGLKAETLVANVPSALVIVGLFALALAVVSERSWLKALAPEKAVLPVKVAWVDFRLWDEMIFVLMVSLLATFTHHDFKVVTVVGANLLSVTIVLYFFQGMAVIYKAFAFFRIGQAWQVLVGLLLTFQLALIVACVGVADYWLEFRARLNRRPLHPSAESK